jgi:aspartyl-tRNA(Asn)/glutamyl-tRNA(Gln) amidotransferase subunit B|tara:strand:- start:9122 stop:10567 length:1446 start_codon:yes stop_codon:yes gene_type:complete
VSIPAGWQIDIGLEIHAQLNTRSKIFSGASTRFGQPPNSQACAIDLGMPGVLPSVNAEVFVKAVQFGLSIGAMINQESRFDRKNYFYPDLPKGYQITQMDQPIVLGGTISIQKSDGTEKTIRVTRAHLEEDAGKSIHDLKPGHTGIDLNRAGTPLLEIVSEPDLKNAEEAVAYAKAMHQLLTYLEVCDGNMAEGSLRFDANISVRRQDADLLGTRSEIKNLNSFRFLEQAIHFETERQISVLEAGGTLVQDTRLFDPDRLETRSMRSKETATDYRYFPEPDLLPVRLTAEFIEQIQANLPELPVMRARRYQDKLQLAFADATLLSQDRRLGDYFDEVLTTSGNAKSAANWVRGDLLSKLNEHELSITACPISPGHLGELIQLIDQGIISGKIAKEVFAALWMKQTDSPGDYVQQHQLEQVSDASAIEPLIDALIADNPKQAEDLRAGKDKLMGFFVGKVMQATAGKANPKQVNDLLRQKLS